MSLGAPPFWQAAPNTSLLAKLLSPLGTIYHHEVQRRLNRAEPYRAGCPVICIGNATMGGVGKTPFVRMLAKTLKDSGHTPHILTRGYGGSLPGPLHVESTHTADDVGDEPLMLARDVPVIVSRDRPAGAKMAADAGATVILMDDGLQNPHIVKDRSLLLVDAASLFGNHEVFPAGPLRERPEASRARSHAVISVLASETETTPESLRSFAGEHPVAEAWFTIDETAMPQGPLLAFCGIGRPERFKASLIKGSAELVDFRAFPDHYPFKPEELEQLRLDAKTHGARLVTTEKDLMRLTLSQREGVTAIPGIMRWRGGDEVFRIIEEVL